ncbi:NifB/NifX family molybdenum-iron cluster-binding protein [Candidatus Neomarinimicrobiota bacterium]
MKIAITALENNLQSLIPSDLQHTNYFLLVNTADLNHYQFIPNMYNKTISGAEIFCSQFLIKQGVNAIICGKNEDQSAQMLMLAGIKIVEMPGARVDEIIKQLTSIVHSIFDSTIQ